MAAEPVQAVDRETATEALALVRRPHREALQVARRARSSGECVGDDLVGLVDADRLACVAPAWRPSPGAGLAGRAARTPRTTRRRSARSQASRHGERDAASAWSAVAPPPGGARAGGGALAGRSPRRGTGSCSVGDERDGDRLLVPVVGELAGDRRGCAPPSGEGCQERGRAARQSRRSSSFGHGEIRSPRPSLSHSAPDAPRWLRASFTRVNGTLALVAILFATHPRFQRPRHGSRPSRAAGTPRRRARRREVGGRRRRLVIRSSPGWRPEKRWSACIPLVTSTRSSGSVRGRRRSHRRRHASERGVVGCGAARGGRGLGVDRGARRRRGERRVGSVLRGSTARVTTRRRRGRWGSASSTTSRSRPPRSPPAARRSSIVDYDAHHGNGTQDCFYRDPRVPLRVVARVPACIPAPARSPRWARATGRGTTINFPFPPARRATATGRRSTTSCSRDQGVRGRRGSSSPPGFDAHRRDPLTGSRPQLRRLSRTSLPACRRRAAGPSPRVPRGRIRPPGPRRLDRRHSRRARGRSSTTQSVRRAVVRALRWSAPSSGSGRRSRRTHATEAEVLKGDALSTDSSLTASEEESCPI